MEDLFLGDSHFSAANVAGTLVSEKNTKLALTSSSSWKCLLKQITVDDTHHKLTLMFLLYTFLWEIMFHLCSTN